MTKFLLNLIIPLVMISAPVFAQSISGTVKSVADGSPIPGVSVSVKGKTQGALTNSQGQYKLAISGENTLIFSAIGYKTQEVATAGRTTVDVTLEETTSSLNEVVVTAMGIAKESRKLGYATTQISAKDITATSPTNFASALYGKAPGVTINANPGGATSAVGIQIRGVNSIGYQRQPLLVVDGVIIRNGDANNEGYWNNQKIGANGLLDINPENIQDINILKGAAASALYGSDANFGVIVITTKNGKSIKKGVGVDVSLSANVEKVSTVPDFQTEWGPGYERSVNMASFGADDQGWIRTTVNGQSVKYPNFRSYAQFGPKMDGSDVYWWDGQMRKYTTQKNNWKQFYRTGSSTIATVALSNATERGSYRLSFTRNDYQGIQIGGKQEKNTFNLNTKYFITPKVTLDVVMNYVNEKVHNRPRQIYYLTNNFGGFFSPADQMSVFFNKYQTSKGYKWVDYNSNLDVEERLKYNVRAKDFLDFLWNQLANKYDETSNRFMPSATLNYNIVKGLNLRGRMGIDYTSFNQETKERSTQPISAGASGYYGTISNNSTYTYGDLLLTYERQLSQKLNATVSVGYQARKEKYNFASAGTRDGLTSENWFSLSASKTSPAQGSSSVEMLLKDGMFGILNLEYNNFLFVEGTVRRERSSSLAPGNNTFVYPGVSSSFELSNAFNLPAAVSYSKLRGAWGVVGNPPDRYIANQVFSSGSIDGTPYLFPATSGFGNKSLKNEMKYEFEIGWENRFLKDRAGFDITYYNNKIKDQITTLGTPSTIGSSSVLRNVGDMRNYGIELSLYGTPVKGSRFSWNTRLNFAMNRSKVVSLADGLAQLTLDNKDNGSLYVYAKPGEAAGSIWGYDHVKDAQGNYVVGTDGFYQIDYSKLVKFGSIQSKFSGGFMNTFTYKNFSLGVLTDFVWGGQVISLSRLYGTGSGLYKNSLFGRDAEHGGVAYYKDATTGKLTGVGTGVTNGPKGEKVYNDGIIAQGVTTGGEKNATIVEAPQYYRYHYNWGGYPGSGSNITYKDAVFDNNFIKLREVSLSYVIPTKALSKLKIQNVTVSAYGRNLFYFYKSLPGLDPEEGVGTGWVSRATSVGAGNAATRSIGGSLRFSF